MWTTCTSVSSRYRVYRKDRRIFLPQIPSSKLGVRRSFQVQTDTSHQPFHPGLCVPLSRVHLSRLSLTQSLKRVGHDGKLCLKVEPRHPPCPIGLAGLGVIGVTGYVTDLYYITCYICGVHTIIRQLTPSHQIIDSTEPFWCLPL